MARRCGAESSRHSSPRRPKRSSTPPESSERAPPRTRLGAPSSSRSGESQGNGDRGGSSWQSLQRGVGAIETDFLNGEIVLLGRLHGIPTPANLTLQHLANELAAGRRPPGTHTEAEVLELVASAGDPVTTSHRLLGVTAALTVLGGAVASTPPTLPVTDPERIDVGVSVEGRPITALRRGDPDGRRVLVIGVIHGDEQAGLDIVDRLTTLPVPDGVDLYLIDAMNPDGVAANTRHNANGVDLNRNFPYNWGPIAEPGNWEYAGPSAASEPETQAMVSFISRAAPRHPDLVPPGRST